MKNLNTNEIITNEELEALLREIVSNTDLDLRKQMLDDIIEELKEIKTVERMPGEIFKLIPGTSRFFASNFGRILKLTKNGESLCRLTRSKNKTGNYYYDVLLELTNGNKLKVRASRVIAKTWLDENLTFKFDKTNKLVVDHKNLNTEDNRIGNLRICTQKENIHYAMMEQNRIVGKPLAHCYAYNIKSGEVLEFNSTVELCKHFYNSTNGGYFNKAAKDKIKVRGEWLVGFNLEDLYCEV